MPAKKPKRPPSRRDPQPRCPSRWRPSTARRRPGEADWPALKLPAAELEWIESRSRMLEEIYGPYRRAFSPLIAPTPEDRRAIARPSPLVVSCVNRIVRAFRMPDFPRQWERGW